MKIKIEILFLFIIMIAVACSRPPAKLHIKGQQPQLSVGPDGVIRLVYGEKHSIWYAESHDEGLSFSEPVLIDSVPGMHLGMSRGPQLASSSAYSVVTAMDKAGDIHSYWLDQKHKKWHTGKSVNDLQGSAPEGLMGLAADDADNFYAVWLDTRISKRNEIFFSYSRDHGMTWTKNKLIYKSPEGHVCECCKPNIAVRQGKIAIMFRNWLAGSRDLYIASSLDGGKTFSDIQKLGSGTWKLDGCPMDGGGVCFDYQGSICTVWQREGHVFFCRSGEMEMDTGEGRLCSLLSAGKDIYLSFQDRDQLFLRDLTGGKLLDIGQGGFIKSVLIPGNGIFCAWEKNDSIQYCRINKSI